MSISIIIAICRKSSFAK